MVILAVDTTNEKGGVAVYRGLNCLAAIANNGPANLYSVSLFQMVDRLLSQAQLALREIELYAVANGPGSFTGIRVGAAAAQAWARAFGRPVRGVSVLEAMVEEARPEAVWAVPILDARRGEFFLARFRRCGRQTEAAVNAFEIDGEGCVFKPQALAAFLEEHLPTGEAVTCLVRDHDTAAQALQRVLPQTYRWKQIPGTLLGAIARLALEARQRGALEWPDGLDAYYIRRPDAELNWQQ